ncbi:gliding motility-associated C-terminal domain-containing protein [Hymenobacter negativus]|uniref:Gliding motility-associated C-terminal domain-containing protein n=1 Tax=Hymenobacter negativus TaxID=2795026 RepID=A0ABS3QF41_9BACT|nr:gliding motility-associated C-terminal domain-containing protein [Hymenobacter negativus]MBO2009860.1 gliding motility-associated C-terminal domain-containing protein [Hymenobacter negativus]
MRTLFTRFALLAAFGLGILRPAAAQQTVYVPAAVTGYTDDVIANGTGTVASSTTNTVDRGIPTVRWCFANSTFPGLSATNSLPANGLINSISTVGLTFQMAPATGNNSLRIDGAGTGTLTLTNPLSCSEVMVLATEGNGTTAADKTFIVSFTDGTIQTFNNVIVPDWFNGTITPAINVGSRVSYVTNAIDLTGSNPRLYEVRLSLAVGNYNKSVQSVTVIKTVQDPVLNVMGISLGSNCLSAPAAGIATANLFPAVVCPNTPVVLALSGNDNSSSITYQWQSAPVGSTTWTDIAGATTNPYTIRPTATAQYRARVICRLLSSTSTPVTVTVLPTTATVSYTTSPQLPATFCTAGTAPVVTATPAGGTFTSTAGLRIDATTGTIDLATTTPGTYTVTYSVPAPAPNNCPAVGTTTVSIIRTIASLTYPETTFCRTGNSGAPAFGPTGGTFSAPAGLAINTSTGIIDLANSTAGTYTITYNSGGQCAASATASVLIKSDALPTFPNIITPNGDKVNDELKPKVADVTNYHIRVFSRWGRKVYDGTDPNAGWTATDSGAGMYYYQVEYNDCAGRHQLYKGWLEVVK